MCKYLLHNFFSENAKAWVGPSRLNARKRGIALGDKKNATPTIANEDLRQTSNWSKLVAAYLPVARLTILDRLVLYWKMVSLVSLVTLNGRL